MGAGAIAIKPPSEEIVDDALCSKVAQYEREIVALEAAGDDDGARQEREKLRVFLLQEYRKDASRWGRAQDWAEEKETAPPRLESIASLPKPEPIAQAADAKVDEQRPATATEPEPPDEPEAAPEERMSCRSFFIAGEGAKFEAIVADFSDDGSPVTEARACIASRARTPYLHACRGVSPCSGIPERARALSRVCSHAWVLVALCARLGHRRSSTTRGR